MRTLAGAALLFAAAASSARAQAPRASATETIALRTHEGTLLSFDLSPDGRRIVFDLLGQLWQLPSTGGVAQPLTDAVQDTAQDLDPSYSPDGRKILFRGERDGRTGLWLIEQGNAPRQLTQLENPDGYDGNATWSPDGKGFAFARLLFPDSASPRYRTRMFWFDLASKATRELPVPADVGLRLRDLAWDKSRKRFAVVAGMAGGRGGRLWLVETDSNRATPLTAESSVALAPAFSPDGQRLAFLAADSADRIQVWVLAVNAGTA